MAQTPEQTGNSTDLGLRLKKAVVARHIYFTFSHAKNIKLLTVFGAVAVLVPPPFGLMTAGVVAGMYGAGSFIGRNLSRSFRQAMGYAQPGDFDVLAEFNRIQRQGHKQVVPLSMVQKTVFPGFEMR